MKQIVLRLHFTTSLLPSLGLAPGRVPATLAATVCARGQSSQGIQPAHGAWRPCRQVCMSPQQPQWISPTHLPGTRWVEPKESLHF